MNKRLLAALGKVWYCEVTNQLPYRSQAKVFDELAELGYVDHYRRMVFTAFNDLVTFEVDGWTLTHAGRLVYCSHEEPPE